MKHIALLLCIGTIISCRHNNSPKSDYTQLIKGDWIGQKTSEGFEHNQTEFISFEDSTIRIDPLHDVFTYQILDDTLRLTSWYDKQGSSNIIKINTLTADSLVLTSSKKQQDTVKYTRARLKNNITPTGIYFASSGCIATGTCPAMLLEIDDNRNIRYYHQYKKGFKGKLTENEYNSLVNKVRSLPLDSLKTQYSDPGTDETQIIAIVHGDKVIHSTVYEHKQEPIELYILLVRLMTLHREADLKPDSTVKKEDFIQTLQLKQLNNLLIPTPNSFKD